jgi:hypothetical protein
LQAFSVGQITQHQMTGMTREKLTEKDMEGSGSEA